MNIALDVDGPVYDWHTATYDYFVGTDLYDGTYEDFWNKEFSSFSKEKQDYYTSLPFLYESMFVNIDVLNILNKLSELGTIYYITARWNDLRRVTERWMRTNKIPQDYNLIMTKDKLNYIKLYKIDYFLDDKTKYIESCKNFCNSYLFAKPWNREEQDKYNTVHSLEEFYNTIKST